nr:DUF4097 family beta strand repeat-containing protein [Bacillus chungangensis]
MIFVFVAFIAIGGLALSVKEAGGKSFKKKYSFEAGSVEEVEINNESWDIAFKNTEVKKVIIAVEGKRQDKKNDPVTIKHSEKKMTVNQEDQGIEGFSFGKKGTIYISIPKGEIDAIILNNKFGDIRMNDVTTKNIVISNDSGAEKIERLSADNGKFVSKEGELRLKDSSLKELTIASTTGDNYLAGVISPKMKITSTDGEVLIKDTKEGKSLLVETKSGDITVSYKEAPTSLTLAANSDSSDITIDLEGFKKKQHTEKSKEGTIGDGLNKLGLLSKHGTINVN